MGRMSIRSRRTVVVVSAVFLLVAGCLAAVYLTANRREVTTSSAAAYQAYREGVENDRRFYKKEARVLYARALSLDPNFVMAMIRLAGLSNQEQARALLDRARKLRSRTNERERLYVDLATAQEKGKREDVLRIAREIREKYPDDVDCAMILAGNEMLEGRAEQAMQVFSDLLA